MQTKQKLNLIFCVFSLLFFSCGLLGALFGLQDDGMKSDIITTPTPICSADSIIIQKILDTNNLKLKIHDVASADAINRVVQINISYSPRDSTKMIDTLIIPEQICRLDSLKELFLQFLKMSCVSIPSKSSKVSNVQTILLGSNRLKAIPANLSFFERLENVHINANQIDSIPTFNINCPNIKWLTLEDNNLRTIPKDIISLSKLKGLYLSNNKLVNLPAEINLLDSLSVLTFRNNKLCNLPDSLAEMLNKFDYIWKSMQNCN